MPNWKKLIVSGSNAVLNQVTASSFLSTTSSGVGFVGTSSWAQSASISNQVETVRKSDNATYHLTFVDSNNSLATPESLYTSTPTLTFNPSTAILTVANVNATTSITGSIISASSGFIGNLTGTATTASFVTGSVNSGNRATYDQNVSMSINWNGRQLMDIDGTTVKIWWANGRNIIYDDSGVESIDWGQRLLWDASNNNAADWANRSLVGNDGITISVDWASGILYDTPGVPSIEWASRRLADVNGQPALDYADTTTNNGVRLYGTASYAISASHLIGGGGSGATFNGGTNVNNRLITATSTTPELNGEANLTFDGSTLLVTGSLIVSGSSTLTNIGPAVFSGSVVSTTGFTGSLSGSVNGTATTASYINGMILKNNAVGGGSFTGNPKKATVTFSTAFPNTSYSVTVTGEDSRTWTIESKLAGSFVINSNSNTALANNVYWQAVSYGEFNS